MDSLALRPSMNNVNSLKGEIEPERNNREVAVAALKEGVAI